MAGFYFAVLGFSHLWCAAHAPAAVLQSHHAQRVWVPPCHQAPSSEHNTPDGHCDDGTCHHTR